MIMLSIWILPCLISFALSNMNFLTEERPRFINNLSRLLNYFKKFSEIIIIYHSIESHQFDTDNVIKMITNDIIIYEINNLTINQNVFYRKVLFLGYHFKNILPDIKIFECFILIHSHQDINMIKEKFENYCAKILLISANGEYWTAVQSKVLQIHDMKNFNRKPNYHKGIIIFLKISSVKENMDVKDYLLQDILRTKWNASIIEGNSSLSEGNDLILYHESEQKYPYVSRVHFLQQICFVVGKSPPSDLWRILVYSFTPSVWILLIFLALIHTKIHHKFFNSIINYFNRRYKWRRCNFSFVNSNGLRLLAATTLLTSIVIMTAVQAIYFAVIRHPMSQPQVNSFEKIQDQNFSLYCYNKLDCINYEKVIKKEIKHSNLSVLDQNTNSALLMPCKLANKKRLQDSKFAKHAHVIDKSFDAHPVFISYNWKFKFGKEFDGLLRSLFENGLFKREEQFSDWKHYLKEVRYLNFDTIKIFLFTFDRFQVPASILILGNGLALIVFFLEILYYKLSYID